MRTRLIGSAVLVLLAAEAGARSSLDAGGWSLHGCATVEQGDLVLEVCTGTCSHDLSWATTRVLATGTYTLDVEYEVDHACCVVLSISRDTGAEVLPLLLQPPGGGFAAPPWCAPTPCTGVLADRAFYAEAGQLLTVLLDGQELGCGLGPANATKVTLKDTEHVPGLLPPVVDAVVGTPAYAVTGVSLSGWLLEQPLTLAIDGAPAPVASATPIGVVALPPTGPPGFHDVELTTPGGSARLVDALPYWPTLRARYLPAPSSVHAWLESGDVDGSWWLLLGLQTLAIPLPIGPQVYHGLELDPLAPLVLVASGSGGLEPVEVVLPIPDDPALAGLVLGLQGLTTTAFEHTGHPYLLSFTNLARVTLG